MAVLVGILIQRSSRSEEGRAANEVLGDPVASEILSVDGSVNLDDGGRSTPLVPGTAVVEQQQVSADPGARVVSHWGAATLVIEGGAQGAAVRWESSRSQERRLRVERGRVQLDVAPLSPGASLIVRTEDALVSVHGTRFLVERSPKGTLVAVDRGVVRVTRGDRTVEVPAGFELSPDQADKSAIGVRNATLLQRVPGPDEALPALPPQTEITPPVDDTDGATEPLIVEEPPPQKRDSGSDVLSSARTLLLKRQYDRAIAMLEALERKRPSPRLLARAQLLEAQALRLKGSPREAVRLLEVAAKGTGPEAEQAQYLRAQVLQRDLHDFVQAGEQWAQGRQRFPRGTFVEESTYREGEALFLGGEKSRALEQVQQYLTQYPQGPHASDGHLLAATALIELRHDCVAALDHFSAVPETHGSAGLLALVGRARCLGTVGRSEESRQAYARYLAKAPRGAYAAEAKAQLSSGHVP
jgi:tetratricopeptide (TPR) repeat protein